MVDGLAGSFSLLCENRLSGFGGVDGGFGLDVASSSSSVNRGDSIRFKDDIISIVWRCCAACAGRVSGLLHTSASSVVGVVG